MARIIARIDSKTGKTEIKSEGYRGTTCKEKTRPFEEKLGTVTSDTPTEEMYTSEVNEQTEQQYG